RLATLLVDPFSSWPGLLRGGVALRLGVEALVDPPRGLEGLCGDGGDEVGVLDGAGADAAVDLPVGGDRAGCVVGLAGGVEETGGLELVVPPAQPVQVPERGRAARVGVVVVVLDDVVGLRGEAG